MTVSPSEIEGVIDLQLSGFDSILIHAESAGIMVTTMRQLDSDLPADFDP